MNLTPMIAYVILIHEPIGYEVEFMTLDGETRAVVSLMPRQIRRKGP